MDFLRLPESISNDNIWDKGSPGAAMSTVPFVNALVNLEVTLTGEAPVSLPVQPVGMCLFQLDSLNFLTPTSLFPLLCPRYWDK